MERDVAYLLDILIAARKALQFVQGMSWLEFAESELHEYSRINLEAVWDTVQSDLPGLISAIEPLVPLEDEI